MRCIIVTITLSALSLLHILATSSYAFSLTSPLSQLESFALASSVDRAYLATTTQDQRNQQRAEILHIQTQLIGIKQQQQDDDLFLGTSDAEEQWNELMKKEIQLIRNLNCEQNSWNCRLDDGTSLYHRHLLLLTDSASSQWREEGLLGLKKLFASDASLNPSIHSPPPQRQISIAGGSNLHENVTVYPTKLDEKLIDFEKMNLNAMMDPYQQYPDLTRASAHWLSLRASTLSRGLLSHAVNSLTAPLTRSELDMLILDLNEWQGPASYQQTRYQFGSRSIHYRLTREQMQILKDTIPALSQGIYETRTGENRNGVATQISPNFIEEWLRVNQYQSTLLSWTVEAPDISDESKEAIADRQARRSYLDQLWQISSDLPIHFNPLRAILQFHVLYYKLTFFHEYTNEQMFEYLALPRYNPLYELGQLRYDEYAPTVTATIQAIKKVVQVKGSEFRAYQYRFGAQSSSSYQHVFNQHNSMKEVWLLTAYLRNYYATSTQNDIGQEWTAFFKREALQEIMAKTKLMYSEERIDDKETLQKYLSLIKSPSELKEMRERVVLEFTTAVDELRNKEYWRSDASNITLHLNIKNVPTMYVRVYNINTRNSYTSALSNSAQVVKEIDASTIDLDGITPNYEQIVKFNSGTTSSSSVNLYHITPYTLSLPHLSTYQRGVFIVELVGAGYRTRAILRKGGLTAAYTVTSSGYLVKLLDRDTKQAVQGHVLIREQSYVSQGESSVILVPFKSDVTTPTISQVVIMSSGDSFSALYPLAYNAEEYRFDAKMYVERESLLARNNATLRITPSLQLRNPSDASMESWIQIDMIKRLSQVQLRVSTTDADGVVSSQVINDIKLGSDSDTIVPFIVPDRLRSVTFDLSADLYMQATGSKQTVTSSFTQQVNRQSDRSVTEGLYLRYDETEGYFFLLLGKTGEIVSQRPVNFQFHHTYLQNPSPLMKVSLQTDESGKILLGQLKDISSITAELQMVGGGSTVITSPATITFQLPGSTSRTTPHMTLSIREGETALVPVDDADFEMSEENVILMRDVSIGFNSPQYDRALTTKNVEFVSASTQRVLRVHSLPAGRYGIWVARTSSARVADRFVQWTILVTAGETVMPGYVFQSGVGTEQKIVQVDSSNVVEKGPLQIVDVKIDVRTVATGTKDTAPEEVPIVRIQLSGVDSSTRVHIVASHFVSPPPSSPASPFTIHPRQLQCRQASSAYLNQVRLSDELRYILDRQSHSGRVGNLLPRPSLFIFDREREETTFAADPILREGQAFAQKMMYGGGSPEMMMGGQRSFTREGYEHDLYLIDDEYRMAGIQALPAEQWLSMEFLQSPAIVLSNLRADPKTNTIDVPISMFDDYQTELYVTAQNADGVIVKTRFTLPAITPSTYTTGTLTLDSAYRDLRLSPPLDSSLHMVESYNITPLLSGSSLNINDPSTSTIETYSSLTDMYNLLRTLTKSSTFSTTLTNFEFLTHWNLLSTTQKQQKYSEYGCHELNIFLRKRDPDFFRSVVQPLVERKLQPMFVDRVLAVKNGTKNDDDLMREFLQPSRFHELNTFEQLLLAESFLESTNKNGNDAEAGMAILQRIIDASNAKQSSEGGEMEQYVRLFNTALQSKGLRVDKKMDEMMHMDGSVDSDVNKKMDSSQSPVMPTSSSARTKRAAAGGPVPMMAAAMMMDSMPPDAEMMRGHSMSDETSMENLASSMSPPPKRFIDIPSTKEYEERGWMLVRNISPDIVRELSPLNMFWSEVAQGLRRKYGEKGKNHPILSKHIAVPTSSFTEVMLALAFIDLPFASDADTPRFTKTSSPDGASHLTLTSSTPMIVFHKEMNVMSTADVNSYDSSISVTVHYLDPQDPVVRDTTGSSSENGAPNNDGTDGTQDKYITSEFLVRHTYAARVILTNIGSRRRRVNVLNQIPAGAIVMSYEGKSEQPATKTSFIELQPFSTEVLTYYFYFPSIGEYAHYPTHGSSRGALLGYASSRTLNVVSRLKEEKRNMQDWYWVSQSGSDEDVLQYLRKENIHSIDLTLLLWRLEPVRRREGNEVQQFFLDVLDILKKRMIYKEEISRYIFKFLTPSKEGPLFIQHLSDYLSLHSTFLSSLGPFFMSDLVKRDVMNDYGSLLQLQHLEYTPLILARAHPLKTGGVTDTGDGSATIQNTQFSSQYRAFLHYLTYRASGEENLNQQELLMLTYYLLLQDRVDEAHVMFRRAENIAAASEQDLLAVADSSQKYLTSNPILDYFRCYFIFYSSTTTLQYAHSIAVKYIKYPVTKWREMFMEVLKQLEEMSVEMIGDGEGVSDDSSMVDDGSDGSTPIDLTTNSLLRDRTMSSLSATSPTLDFHFTSPTTIELVSTSVSSVRVNFYVIEVEQMFSREPFSMVTGTTTSSSTSSSGSSLPPALLFVEPSSTMVVKDIPLNSRTPFVINLPAASSALKQNCWIEVTTQLSSSKHQQASSGGGAQLSVVRPYFSTDLSVDIASAYGQLHVRHTSSGSSLARVYVKVYAEMKDTGAVEFYKDGYTDGRGKFDYATLSTKKLARVSRFSLLVYHNQYGAVVREAKPPSK